MPATGFTWTVPPDKAFAELAQAYATAIQNLVVGVCQKFAAEIENWMKANAPWTDRTANARQSLHTAVEQTLGQLVTLIMAHGMEYGWYLEGINPATMQAMQRGGLYAVVEPALDYWAPKVWAAVRAGLAAK